MVGLWRLNHVIPGMELAIILLIIMNYHFPNLIMMNIILITTYIDNNDYQYIMFNLLLGDEHGIHLKYPVIWNYIHCHGCETGKGQINM